MAAAVFGSGLLSLQYVMNAHAMQLKKIADIKHAMIMEGLDESKLKEEGYVHPLHAFKYGHGTYQLILYCQCIDREFVKVELIPLWPKQWMNVDNIMRIAKLKFPPLPPSKYRNIAYIIISTAHRAQTDCHC